MFKAITCLLLMAECCGDFLRARTVKQVLPRLNQFLTGQRKNSSNKPIQCAHFLSLEYRLQQKILTSIGTLCRHLKLGSPEIWSVLAAVCPYTMTDQPLQLRVEAATSMKHFEMIDPYSVFYYQTVYGLRTNVDRPTNKCLNQLTTSN